MSEGKLKEEINKVRIDSNTQSEIFDILDEAKKEYLQLKDKWLQKHPNGKGDWHGDELADMRHEWFKRWFGEAETK
jgi:hypothetical protein